MKISVNELTKVCQYYFKEIWGEELNLPIEISPTMVKTLGYFQIINNIPSKIRFSKRLLENYKPSTIESVIKHELCHCYLFSKERPFHDGHPVFENEIKRIGASSTHQIKHAGDIHVVRCEKCGKITGTYNSEKVAKGRTQNYISSCCRAEIIYAGKQIIEDTFKKQKGEIKSKSLEEVLKLINGKTEIKEIKEIKENENIEFDITKYVEVTSKKPTQENVYYTLIKLIDLNKVNEIKALSNLYNKHFTNCLKYLSKKRRGYLILNNLMD